MNEPQDKPATNGKSLLVVDLLKYPLLVFSILLSLVIAKPLLGLEFGAVAEVGTGGVKFTQGRATVDALANLDSKVNGALEEIKLLKNAAPRDHIESDDAKARIFEANQVVSDQTAKVQSIQVSDPKRSDRVEGYVWIGNFNNGTWRSPQLARLDTGQQIAEPPNKLAPGTEYKALGNLVIRDGLPANDAEYYKARSPVGVVPRGARVRLTAAPTGIDREYAVQYWVKIELLTPS